MRAISSYLLAIGERTDALEEIADLLDVAPEWYMAANQAGLYYGTGEDVEKAARYYQQVLVLKPQHFIGYFNLACLRAMEGRLAEGLDYLLSMLQVPEALSSIRETMRQLSHDPDLRPLFTHPDFADKVRDLELAIFPDSPAFSPVNTPADWSYYTF